MYLSSPGVNQTVNYGVLHVLDLVTLTTTTFPLILPVPANTSINTMHSVQSYFFVINHWQTIMLISIYINGHGVGTEDFRQISLDLIL